MKNLFLLGLIGLAAASQASPVIFYGGDFDGVSDLSAQVGDIDSRVYDNFTLASTTTLDGVFGNFTDASSGNSSSVYWEIRSGITAGNGGTLLFSGTDSGTRTAVGDLFNYSASITPINLAAGDYFLSVSVSNADGQTWVKTTSGLNGVGGPLNDGNSFWDSSTFGQVFEPTSSFFGTSKDFSMGLTGSAVPEPASFAVLGLGAVALIRRRRK
jgi:hypothetical protein